MECKYGFSARLSVFFLIAAVAMVGCAPQISKPVRHCPGKTSAEQALATLQDSASKLRPFVAYGSGRVSYYTDKKDKPRNEKIPTIKLWFDPPGNLRFWGEVAFNPRGLDVGSNEQEFWFAAKPKEIGNVYIWGLWSQQTDAAGMLLSPAVLQQALGVIDTPSDQIWSLSNVQSSDVLALLDQEGRVSRKVYIENCDYRIGRIEYFGDKQELVAVLRLGDYRDVDGMFVPASIEMESPGDDGTADTFEISLKSIKPADKIKDTVFKRPDTKGFEEVRQIIKGRTVRTDVPR